MIAEQAAFSAVQVRNLSDQYDAPAVYPRLLNRPGVGEAEYE